jgi:beta-glucosidase
LSVYSDGFVTPYRGFIAESDPGVTDITTGGRSLPTIAASSDAEGLAVTWSGDSGAAVFLQSPGNPRDLSRYVNLGARLVFDVTVLHPPTEFTTIAVHCDHPCGSSLRAEKIFQELPVGEKTTLSISLTCYTVAGLDATRVDTPFLVYSEAEFSAVFANVRWELQPETEPTNHSCGPLL